MRTIKTNVNSLEKNQYDIEAYAYQTQAKKKNHPQSKSPFDKPQRTIQNDQRHHYGPHDPIIENAKEKSQKQDSQGKNEQKKQVKSAIKLPTIKNRLGKNTTETDNGEITVYDQYNQNNEVNNEGKRLSNNAIKRNFQDPIKENKEEPFEKVNSFLRFIQIKPMKPEEKNYTRENDLSVRDFKAIKNEKALIIKPSQTQIVRKTKMVRKSSQKTTIVNFQEKQERGKTVAYSIKKDKKALSITQPLKKKISNTYHDFCFYICLLNKMARPTTPSASYRAYVGKGNNSILVKNSLKNRFWWVIVDSESQVNLHWTQCKDSKFLQGLKCFDKEKKKQQEFLIKKIQFNLTRESHEKNDQLKEYTGLGLNKLLSKEQKKRFQKGNFSVEVPLQSNYKKIINPNKIKVHNHLQFHWHISNKKALYYNLKKYYEAINENPFQYIPLTFHVQKDGDNEWNNFQKAFFEKADEISKKGEKKKKKEKNMWIVKPGENSNQGCGIQVFDNIEQIKQMIRNKEERVNGKSKSFIIQKYLMPFLYNKRKFDIRCYMLVTSVNSIMKAYWYEEGYIRTSCKEFTTKNLKNRLIHLTNDSVQKKSEDYGKFQNGNKISFQDFQKYLDTTYQQKNYKFYSSIYPEMIKSASDTIKSTCMLMDANNRQFSFEIFGLDYMIDEDFNVWLIEVNTNPCLELSSPLLARIIPNMMENALKIGIDPIFPPPKQYPKTKTIATDLFDSNKFTLIFTSSEEEQVLANLTKDTNLQNIIESDEDEENHDQIQ